MDVTFLVTLNLDDLSDLPGVASDIGNDLTETGFEVKSVAPWARPSLTTGVPQAAVPNITPTQPTIET